MSSNLQQIGRRHGTDKADANHKFHGLKPLVVDNPAWRIETIGDPHDHGCFEKGSVGLAKLTKL